MKPSPTPPDVSDVPALIERFKQVFESRHLQLPDLSGVTDEQAISRLTAALAADQVEPQDNDPFGACTIRVSQTKHCSFIRQSECQHLGGTFQEGMQCPPP
jgi:hypothetical protein